MLSRTAASYEAQGIRVYNIKPNNYHSEMVQDVADIIFDGDANKFAAVNNFFKKTAGDPMHIGHIVKAFVDNSTKYPCGANVICDGDATFSADIMNKYLDNPDDSPVFEMWLSADQLRGYDGGPYKCQSQATCDYVKSLEPKKHTVTFAALLPIPAATARDITSFANAVGLLGIEAQITGDGVSVGSVRTVSLGGATVFETLVSTTPFGYSYAVDFDKSEDVDKLIPHDFSDHLGTVAVVEVDEQSSVITYTLAFKTTEFDKLKPMFEGMLGNIVGAIPKKAAEMNGNKEL